MLGRDGWADRVAIERLAAGEELAVYGGGGAHAQGVALAAPYGHAVVEGGPLGGLQLGRSEEVGDLAWHVYGDGQLRDRDVLVVDSGVYGQEVSDGRADGAAADLVVADEGGDGATLQVRGAHGVGLVGRDDGAAATLVALGRGGSQPVVGQLGLEVALQRRNRAPWRQLPHRQWESRASPARPLRADATDPPSAPTSSALRGQGLQPRPDA